MPIDGFGRVPDGVCAICEEVFDASELVWSDSEADYVCYQCLEGVE